MTEFFNSLSTREIAWLFWAIITITLALITLDVRKEFISVFSSLQRWKIYTPILLFLVNTSTMVFIFSVFEIWNFSLLKDTLVWTCTFGIVWLIKLNKIDNTLIFRNIIFDSIKWTILLEFVLNFFTFSLLTEIVLVPIFLLIGIFQLVISNVKKIDKYNVLISQFLKYFSVYILLFSAYKTVENHDILFTTENFKNLLLPALLTLTFLPFLYTFNLIAKYETLWTTLEVLIKNKVDRKRIKYQILCIANVNLNKVININRNIVKPICVYNDLSYDMLIQVSKGEYIGFDEQAKKYFF